IVQRACVILFFLFKNWQFGKKLVEQKVEFELSVAAGREWFIHAIYTVRSRDNANRGIGKRSLEYHVISQKSHLFPNTHRRIRRSANGELDVVDEIGVENNRGTNILHIALDRSSQQRTGPEREIVTKGIIPRELNQKDSDDRLVLIIGIFVGLLLTVLLIVVVVFLVRSKQEKKEALTNSGSTEPMITQNLSNNDSSEV
uniref:Uncharacterized protein n=1 Tax=Fundulus heteroclitus TaxID=8078 RepID=A0A3Q2SRB8_FUNHE